MLCYATAVCYSYRGPRGTLPGHSGGVATYRLQRPQACSIAQWCSFVGTVQCSAVQVRYSGWEPPPLMAAAAAACL